MSESNTSCPVYRLYKGNSPFEGQSCFADYLNGLLREGKDLPMPWMQAATELDALIAASPLTEHVTLYRATVDVFVAPYINGSVLAYPAYMSTSSTQEGLQRHFSTALKGVSAALLTIECEPGAHALNMELEASFGGHEHEFLLPRCARFQLDSIRTSGDRQEMSGLMSPLYADSYTDIKLYDLRYLRGD